MLYSSQQSCEAVPSLFQAGPARPRKGGQQDREQEGEQQQKNREQKKPELVGPASKELRREILKMYWDGVKDELDNILLTLHRWQATPSFTEPLADEETDDNNLVRGYKTFLKNVCHNPHSNGKFIGLPKGQNVEDNLRDTESVGLWQKRALMLLQSAQFLDIDSLFEYRSPTVPFYYWNLCLGKRLSSPQLNLEIKEDCPSFYAPGCSKCHFSIRSSSYHNIDKETEILCETCFRTSDDFKNGQYRKHYKTCCLPSELTHEEVAQLCHCPYRHNENEEDWPLDLEAEGSCLLFALNQQIAEKKNEETSEAGIESKFIQVIQALYERAADKMDWPKRLTGGTKKLPNLNSEVGYPLNFDTSRGKALSVEEVPLYLRPLKKNYPFGNVHVALRFGPLTFENGVPGTKGVTISTRDTQQLQVSKNATSTGISLELTEKNLETEEKLSKDSGTRTVYRRPRDWDTKRYKAMAKQIVGGAFCGLIDRKTELDIAETLVRESYKLDDDEYDIRLSTNSIFETVNTYLSSRVDRYVDSIVERLLDPKVALRYQKKENSCQTFCDNIIDTETFGSLFAPQTDAPEPSPLYLMSFVCRSSDYIARGPGPSYNTPYGHVEEYLFKYRFGRHDESDIIDTLQEYWYDWGNFKGCLYPYQDIFPWDCTEGFGESRHRCGTCNISEHVWAFPFDSFSLISLHLSRERYLYPQRSSPMKPYNEQRGDGKVADRDARYGIMRDSEWFKNRLTLLMGQYSLLMGATAMAQCYGINQATSWMWNEKEDVYVDRIKLGGIIRAQPFSHHFERGSYYQYFVAEWTSLKLSDRIEQYERLRDWRARLGGGLDGLNDFQNRKKRGKMYGRDGGGSGGGGSGRSGRGRSARDGVGRGGGDNEEDGSGEGGNSEGGNGEGGSGEGGTGVGGTGVGGSELWYWSGWDSAGGDDGGGSGGDGSGEGGSVDATIVLPLQDLFDEWVRLGEAFCDDGGGGGSGGFDGCGGFDGGGGSGWGGSGGFDGGGCGGC